jgi:hypothetical protein
MAHNEDFVPRDYFAVLALTIVVHGEVFAEYFSQFTMYFWYYTASCSA